MAAKKPTIVGNIVQKNGVLTRTDTNQPLRLCIDADCPSCGWVERWYDFGTESFGCNKCEYTSKSRNE